MVAMVKSLASDGRPTLRFVWSHPAHVVSLSGGLGVSPWAPGTVGAAGAVLPAWLLLALPWPWLAVIFAATFCLGIWAADVTGRALGIDDPGCVVFDETWAMALVFLAIPAHPVWWLAGFVAFRFFDIVKPQPIRAVQDNLSGGLGVMADDLAAAIAAIAAIDLAVYAVGRF
ncbi:phosphatidylglycerophosphatase A family protein [Pinisolibacter sp.]|uniref:phosphatidylglycerophosphatase A family protein n=1 Tax=Pinisolibacter sp. TaxID=2172024 RepID=UPI002FDED106